MDLHEDNEKNLVTASFEVPGLKKEDLEIETRGGQLLVSGETRFSADKEEHGYAVRERRFGRFSRVLKLPQGVKVSVIRYSQHGPVHS
jgi:HSP20 family protein